MDKGSKKEKLIVQGICLLLSIGLWFYISNVENSIRTIDLDNVPVQLIGTESLEDMGLALNIDQEFKVNIKIEGQVNDIYKINKDQFVLEANLSEYALKKGENRVPVKVVDYPSSINIKNTITLSVKVNLDEYKEKAIPIKSEITVKAASGFFVGEPVLSQNEAIISGPSEQVEKVQKLVARGVIENVTSNIVKSYNLLAVDREGEEVEGVTLSKTSVDITIPVSKGKIVPIKVQTKGTLSQGKLVDITSSTNSVELNGPEEITKNISEVSTVPIDLGTITESGEINVKLAIPEGVTVASGKDVIKVKVNIEKLTTKEITLAVNIKGKKEDENYKFSTEEVKIKISGYKDKLDLISAENFTAEIDVTGLSLGEHELKPTIVVKENENISYEVLNSIKVTITKI